MTATATRAATRLALATGSLALGAWAGLALPAGLAAIVAMLALGRILWLEQNVFEDLTTGAPLPHAYRGAARRSGVDAPPLLATAMRAEAQAWGAAAFGLAASLALSQGEGAVALLSWAVLMVQGFRRTDRLVETLDHLSRGRALPLDRLRRPSGLGLSSRRDDPARR